MIIVKGIRNIYLIIKKGAINRPFAHGVVGYFFFCTCFEFHPGNNILRDSLKFLVIGPQSPNFKFLDLQGGVGYPFFGKSPFSLAVLITSSDILSSLVFPYI